MDVCPRCGRILEVIECCGGGIFRCSHCNEYYYPGELIDFHKEREKVLEGDPSEPLLRVCLQKGESKEPER